MGAAAVVQVVTVGKSSGSTTMASALACGLARRGVRSLIVEADPSGGDLTARLGRVPSKWLSDLATAVEEQALLDAPVELASFVTDCGVDGVGVVMGDPYGLRLPPRFGDGDLGVWAGAAGWDRVVVDSGRAQPGVTVRRDAVSVYAVVDANVGADLDRGLRGCHDLARELGSDQALFVVVKECSWPSGEVQSVLSNPDWSLTNVGSDRPVRKTWKWFRAGEWESAVASKGMARFEAIAGPAVSVLAPADADPCAVGAGELTAGEVAAGSGDGCASVSSPSVPPGWDQQPMPPDPVSEQELAT